MIPRTKVNYRLRELLGAWFVRERGQVHKKRLAAILGELLGRAYVLPLPSGRAGLYFLLKAIERPRVIVPAYTCKAVVEAALMAGKEVVFAASDANGFNSPLGEYEKVAGGDCVIVATHQFGIPCEIEGLCALARARNALVVEDAAASLGSRVGGRLTGTFGTAAFFSFDSTKLVNVPMKGGAVVTDDRPLFERLQAGYQAETKPMPGSVKAWSLLKATILVLLEHHLSYRLFHWGYFKARGKFTADGPGLKLKKDEFYRFDLAEWQAAIAGRQITDLNRIIEQRQRLYAEYRRRLGACRSFRLPPEDKGRQWACIRFPIRVAGDKLDFYRRAVRRGLDLAFSFTFLGCPDQFTCSHRLAGEVLDLPFYLKLTPREMEDVVRILLEIDAELSA